MNRSILAMVLIACAQVMFAQCTLSATSSGSNPAYAQVYVLVDASGNILAQNTTGTFTGVSNGNYRIHALNYDPTNPPDPLPSSLIGLPVTNVGNLSSGCYNSDFLIDFVNRSCASCYQNINICENDPLTVSTSGYNSSYSQVYVLADINGMVLSTSSSGDFSGLISAGNSYRIYALNYDPLNAPSPLPLVGSSVSQVGVSVLGCFNADFLSDYLCVNVTSCASACFKSVDVCANSFIDIQSSGSNLNYEQVYVLTDDNGNFLDQNNSGFFPASALVVGNTYHLYALNYDPTNPPNNLPSSLSVGDPISNINGGCYNADYLTDYVCINIISCTNTCFESRNVCENEDIIVSASGYNAAYNQVYVLCDDNGNFIAQNTTGVFSTSTLITGNVYHVHALNYDPTNPPNTLPIDLSIGDPLSNVSGGCYNADFLTDFLCYTIGCPCDGKLVQYAPDQQVPGANGSVNYTVASAYCDDLNGWRYYFDPSVPEDLLFAIKHKPVGGNTNDFTARVILGVNDYATTTGYDEPQSGQDYVNFEANFAMGRYWDVEVLSGSLNGNVDVRFFYKPAEYNTTNAAAADWKQAYEPSAIAAGYLGLQQLVPYWFKTNDATAYDPVPDLSPVDVNNGNVQLLNPDFIGSDADVINNNKNYVEFDDQIFSFSGGTVAFRVTPINNLLANDILNFNGEKQEKTNLLFWEIDVEENIESYELERSEDGIYAYSIGLFEPLGRTKYEYVDPLPPNRAYYRLKMNLLNGGLKYSNWIILERDLSENHLRIYPNPTQNWMTLDFNNELVEPYTIELFNAIGQLVYSKTIEPQLGKNRININLSELSTAVYTLNFGPPGNTIIRKITKM